MQVQIPYSPGGDGNKRPRFRLIFWFLFRHLTPREGTETLWAIFVTIPPTCSDALLPVRGRKPVEDSVNLCLDLVQIPFSPGGDENLYGWCSSSGISSFRHLTPRERTETDSFYNPLIHGLTVQIPFSPGGDGNIKMACVNWSIFPLFRHPTPREGTETWRTRLDCNRLLEFRYLSPREGTEIA